MKFALTGTFLFVLYGLTAAVNVVHIFVPELLTWDDAQTFCKTFHTDMSYITSEADHQMLTKAAGGTFFQGWIGLYRRHGNPHNWMWSSTHAYDFSKLDYEKQAGYDCVYATLNLWQNYLCTLTLNFFCYDNFELRLVKENLTWEEALEHCRSYYIDLVGATSQDQFDLLSAADQNSITSQVWMGLRFLTEKWIWVSKSFKYLNFTGSLPSCPAEPYRCGAYNKITGQLENRNCDEKLNFICY